LRRLHQLAQLVGIGGAGHLDDDVAGAVDGDAGLGDAAEVDPLGDDLPGLLHLLAVGRATAGRAGGQRHAGAALQVQAELRMGLLVAGEEHQPVQGYDDQRQSHEVS
jgi:hypothetical protein